MSQSNSFSTMAGSLPDNAAFSRWLIIGVVLTNLTVMVMVAFSIYQSRELSQENAKVTAQNLVDVLAHNINNDIAKVDISLQACVDEIERVIAAGKTDRPAITAFLARQQQRLPHIETLRATDAQGTALYGLGVPASSPPSMADRDFFIRQRDNPNAGLVINKPVLSRLNKIWLMNVSRRINHPDGSFAGVVFSGTAIAYYHKMFAGLNVGKYGAINLRDQDMGVIARYPTPQDIGSILGDRTISPEYRQHLDVDQQAGTFYTPASFDGIARVVSYQKLSDYPLYISVGLSEEDYLTEWRQDSVKLLLLTGLFALISVIFARLLYTAWKRQLSVNQALYESQSRLNALFENMNSGVAVFRVSEEGQHFIFSALNHEAEHIDNVRREDVLGQNVADIFPNIVELGLLNVFRRVWKSGMAEQFPVFYYRHGRIASWRENSVYPLPTGEIVMIYNDMTQLKQAEETQHENEMRLRRMGDNLPDSYLYEFTYQDGKPCFLYLSSGVERLNGIKIDDALKNASLLLGQIAQEQMPAYFDAENVSRNELTDFSMNLHIKKAEDEWRWIHVRSHPRKRENGQVIWDGIVTDITDRHLYDAEINRLAQAVEQNPTGILITDLQGEVFYTNQAYTRITGYQLADMYEKTPRELLSTEISDTEFNHVQACLAAGKPWTGILRNRHKDGGLYWEQINASPVYDDTGMIANYLYLRMDITETKKAEEELRRYKDHLEEQVQERTSELLLARNAAEAANKAKSVFLANMSHELRTPLNAILGFSSMMRRDPQLTENQSANIDIINRSGEHLLTLINDVLEMAKIEAGRLQLESTAFDLGCMVRDVTEMMQIRAQEKGLRLLLDQSAEFPLRIKSDEARIRQILINLINNAVKFTEQGGVSIRLGMKQNTPNHLLIEVEDSGPGIAPKDLTRLFEPFVQLTKGGAQRGTGLGLTITRQFVKLLGGSIMVESTLGKGSIFRVELPVELAGTSEILQPEHRVHGEVEGLVPGQPNYRILIAEDQHDNQLLLSQLMTAIGLEVKVAENGEQCVKFFQDWHPDLIWMDREMPVMDGVEATKRIRQLPEGDKVKIVAVTASAFKEQQQEMLDAGMDDLVRKPYRFNEIYDCLARHLGIKYRYHSEIPAEDAAPVILTAAMLAVLPAALREELRESLENLDGERITSAIRQIGEIDPKLGSALTRLAEYFDYPAILNALDQTSDG